jgi:hypothetical protein
MNGFNSTNSLHTGGVTGSIPVAPTIDFNHLAAFKFQTSFLGTI